MNTKEQIAYAKWKSAWRRLLKAEDEYTHWKGEYEAGGHYRSGEQWQNLKMMYLEAGLEAYEATLEERAARKELAERARYEHDEEQARTENEVLEALERRTL